MITGALWVSPILSGAIGCKRVGAGSRLLREVRLSNAFRVEVKMEWSLDGSVDIIAKLLGLAICGCYGRR